MKHSTFPPQHDDAPGQVGQLRQQIATIAARYIAEDGATYAIAKQKAAQQVLGAGRVRGEVMPDNDLIEQQVMIHNQLFLSDRQPQRLLQLRRLALQTMQDLEQFNPHLTGAVLSGSAGQHDAIVIQLFVDNGKDVAIYLLNRGVQFDVSEALPNAYDRNDPIETLSFTRNGEDIHLVLLASDDVRRTSAKKSPRANIEAVTMLIDDGNFESEPV